MLLQMMLLRHDDVTPTTARLIFDRSSLSTLSFAMRLRCAASLSASEFFSVSELHTDLRHRRRPCRNRSVEWNQVTVSARGISEETWRSQRLIKVQHFNAADDVASNERWIQLFHYRCSDRQFTRQSAAAARQRHWRVVHLVWLHVTHTPVCRQLLQARRCLPIISADRSRHSVEVRWSGSAGVCWRCWWRVAACVPCLPPSVTRRSRFQRSYLERHPATGRDTSHAAATSNEILQQRRRWLSLDNAYTVRDTHRRSSHHWHHIHSPVIHRPCTQ